MKQEVGMACGCPRTQRVAMATGSVYIRWAVAKSQRTSMRQVAELESTFVFVLSFQIIDSVDGNQRRGGALITHTCACKHVNTAHRCSTRTHMNRFFSLDIFRPSGSLSCLFSTIKVCVWGMPQRILIWWWQETRREREREKGVTRHNQTRDAVHLNHKVTSFVSERADCFYLKLKTLNSEKQNRYNFLPLQILACQNPAPTLPSMQLVCLPLGPRFMLLHASNQSWRLIYQVKIVQLLTAKT